MASSAYIFCKTYNVFFKINQDCADHSFTSYWASQIQFVVMVERLDLMCSFKSSILVSSVVGLNSSTLTGYITNQSYSITFNAIYFSLQETGLILNYF